MNAGHVYDVVVLGAGFGGLGMGAELVRNGIDDFVIVERSNRIGGVWRDNVYPGAACDTQSVIYCYSYLLNTRVSRMYAGQSELLGYLHRLSAEFDLDDHTVLDTEVRAANWNDNEAYWEIETSQGRLLGRIFVPAWGQLGVPQIPSFTGSERFKGITFHSACWPADFDPRDKRIASIGAAASAVQYVPEIAAVAKELVVFQRSANYILPRDQQIFSAEERVAFEATPETYISLRDEIHEQRETGFARTRLNTSAHEQGAADARRHLDAQVPDPELRRKLTPDYEFGCKRILRSDDYYPALTRPNVTLETASIERMTETGIVTTEGVEYGLDVITYGTGFRSQAFNDSIAITGRDGIDLDERWGDSPEAYLGLAVDGFPNMFLVYGPNTNLNHNSVVTMLEAQHRYIVQAVQYITGSSARSIEVKQNAVAEFNAWIQNELKQSAFSSDCSSWYKNAAGKVINNWSGTADEYGRATATLQLADYTVDDGVAR